MKKLFLLAAVCLLSACASITEGTTQEITVTTTPAGATCVFTREAKEIGRIVSTPGSLTVKKNKYDIIIACTKDGYQETTYLNKSDVAGATVGNILLGGGIGWAIDSARGADNKYKTPVDITLTQ